MLNSRNWTGWPECPRCSERREVRCAVCHARGTEFPLADMEGLGVDEAEAAESGEDVLLLCSTCDEPFLPRFFRRCDSCGHDFGDGIEESEVDREELNNRIVFVMIGVVVLMIGLLGFFALVLRG